MSSRAPRGVWLAACALMAPSLASAQPRAATELVEAIVGEGPRAIAIRAAAEVVRRDQASRLAFPNPAVSYSREGAGFTEFLQVEQPLPIFGIRGTLARAGVAATAAAEAERDARLWNLRIEGARAVARWAWAESREALAVAEIEAVERLVEVMRIREREGEGSRFDRLRAEQELADLQQVAVDASIDRTDARAAVQALLPAGFAVSSVSMPASGMASAPFQADELWTRAQTSRAELRALQAGADRTTLEAEAARRARWPVPVASGGLKRADTGVEREAGTVVGFSLSVPLFDTGSRDAARWSAEGTRIAAERTAIEQQVRAEIQRAVDALQRRRRARADTDGDAPGAELATTAEVAYREGEIGVVTLLDALRTASRARVRDLDRRLDLWLAKIALEGAVGEVLWP